MTENEYRQRIVQLEREVAELKSKLTAKQKATRYGLVWEDVPEAFEKEAENKIPILEEVKDKAIKNDDGKPTHILIEGDNFHALQCLNYTHRGKVDVIYIDPPYNTGSDGFTYKDKRTLDRFPDGQTIDTNHPLRHSAWLSFMSKRLELAKNLLSEKGVIFISIDDNEQANLKLLCDKVFGEKNFVATVCQKSRDSISGDLLFSPNHNFLLLYANKFENIFAEKDKFRIPNEVDESKFKNPDKDPRGPWKLNPVDGPGGARKGNPYYEFLGVEGYFRYSKEMMQKYYDDGLIIKRKKSIGKKYFLSQALEKKGEAPTTWWDDAGTTTNGTRLLKDILLGCDFSNPKPIELIIRCLQLISFTQQETILDFFAGSGTTLHATMKLNAEDGGKRQCILVQQKEGDKNICEQVTYERNRRVMQGYTNAKGEKIEGLGNSLKYYRTAFVGNHDAATATDEDKVALAHKAGCLIAIAENTLEEVEANNAFQIFQDGTHYTAVYFSGNLGDMPDFTEKLESLRNSSRLTKIEAYIYCLGNVQQFENEFDSLTRINLHAIPQPIIEIYKQLNA